LNVYVLPPFVGRGTEVATSGNDDVPLRALDVVEGHEVAQQQVRVDRERVGEVLAGRVEVARKAEARLPPTRYVPPFAALPLGSAEADVTSAAVSATTAASRRSKYRIAASLA
jgi:hypothetical protein